jgi:hypothetical protein
VQPQAMAQRGVMGFGVVLLLCLSLASLAVRFGLQGCISACRLACSGVLWDSGAKGLVCLSLAGLAVMMRLAGLRATAAMAQRGVMGLRGKWALVD